MESGETFSQIVTTFFVHVGGKCHLHFGLAASTLDIETGEQNDRFGLVRLKLSIIILVADNLFHDPPFQKGLAYRSARKTCKTMLC